MATLDIKLKTYEQLQFEVLRLITDNHLKDKEIERLNNIINELEGKIYYLYNYAGLDTSNLENELKELKGETNEGKDN